MWFYGIYEALFRVLGSVLYNLTSLELLYCFIYWVYGVFMPCFIVKVMDGNGSGSQEGMMAMVCAGGFAEFTDNIFLLD